MANLLIIEDSVIRALTKDPRALDVVPCLRATKQTLEAMVSTGCQLCQRQRSTNVKNALAAAKQCIAGLRGSQLASLKKILGARQLRVVVRRAGGSVTRHTL